MSFAQDLISQLEQATAGSHPPRVRALHLPPPEAAGSKNGEFCALELDDGSLGLSYVLLDDALRKLTAQSDALDLAGMDALELARRFASGSGIQRTVGFAAANALSRCVMDRAGFVPPPSTDSIGGIDPRPGDYIGMIGLFTPLLKRVTAAGARLTVIELNPDWAGSYDGYRVTLDAAELADCNKVLSTSTVLLNDTLDAMLAHCHRASTIALIGPSAGCLPDPLFARGVTLVGGSWITEREGFVDALLRGASWGEFAFKFAVTTRDWAARSMLRQ